MKQLISVSAFLLIILASKFFSLAYAEQPSLESFWQFLAFYLSGMSCIFASWYFTIKPYSEKLKKIEKVLQKQGNNHEGACIDIQAVLEEDSIVMKINPK